MGFVMPSYKELPLSWMRSPTGKTWAEEPELYRIKLDDYRKKQSHRWAVQWAILAVGAAALVVVLILSVIRGM